MNEVRRIRKKQTLRYETTHHEFTFLLEESSRIDQAFIVSSFSSLRFTRANKGGKAYRSRGTPSLSIAFHMCSSIDSLLPVARARERKEELMKEKTKEAINHTEI